jgi:hypothetical protein
MISGDRTNTVCYTNGCLRSNVIPDDGYGERPKHIYVHIHIYVEFLK